MFVELLCKSNFSFLRGASDSREYVLRAEQTGARAVGISDINGVYALPRAYEAIRDHCPNLKLICGAEVTVENHPSIHLIAKNRKGWGLLCRILTQVHRGKEKGEGFITFDELEFLCKKWSGATDLFCLMKNNEKNDFLRLKELFGSNCFLVLCRHLDGLDSKRNALAFHLSEQYGLPLVASNDVHYHDPKRRPLQDCFVCIREGRTLDTAGFLLFANEERYLKSPLQMSALFSDCKEALENSVWIADQCHFSLSELRYKYPKEAVPKKSHSTKLS